MSYHFSLFQEGDAVFYTGERFRSQLNSGGKSMKGWIHAPVRNQPGFYVVFFPETKEQDSFVMSERVLTKARPPRVDKVKDDPVVEHMPARKRKSEDE